MPQPQPIAFSSVKYAGFWRRFAAWLIDGLILGAISTFISIIGFGSMFGGILMRGGHAHHFYYHYDSTNDFADPAIVMSLISMYFTYLLLWLVGGWLYHALMESSTKQGTLGKMAVGIKVTDLNGNRLTFARATGRWFSKILSSMTLTVGYIIAGFTEKKQALHDFVAGTLVVVGN